MNTTNWFAVAWNTETDEAADQTETELACAGVGIEMNEYHGEGAFLATLTMDQFDLLDEQGTLELVYGNITIRMDVAE